MKTKNKTIVLTLATLMILTVGQFALALPYTPTPKPNEGDENDLGVVETTETRHIYYRESEGEWCYGPPYSCEHNQQLINSSLLRLSEIIEIQHTYHRDVEHEGGYVPPYFCEHNQQRISSALSSIEASLQNPSESVIYSVEIDLNCCAPLSNEEAEGSEVHYKYKTYKSNIIT